MSLFSSEQFENSLSDSLATDNTTATYETGDSQASKKADLAGPGIGNYADLEAVLPQDYNPLLTRKETQRALFHLRRYIEDNLCKELGLQMVQVPLIVDAESGVNDMLDRDGSRTPIQFHISNDRGKNPIDAQVVQAATKWKRVALKQFECRPGEGICTDMRAVRKDYFLDHDHSAYVDQWDWERVITPEQRNIAFLKSIVRRIWKVLVGAEKFAQEMFPELRNPRYPNLPEELTFLHAEELLAMYPDLPRKRRETFILQKYPAVFIIGIGWPLKDGYPHEMRAADYDDWVTDTSAQTHRDTHGLNGDILVWNPVTQRRHELSSMGIRVNAETLHRQLEISNLLDNLKFPYHQGIINNVLPLSIGGGIGQSRTLMLLLRKAHLGEVSVTVWPKILKEMCAKKNIFVLE
ncbi:MAG TPA: aspartate--ammonia ligase [Candidatus Dormibacteraeota bacterium]|nr:aspartate--ammonia ligase [Candidatus Dormibacteraeota bacterium]